MKKGTSFFYIFIAILGITFSSCNFKLKESNNYNKPDVKVTENQVTVVIPCINSKTKYINVYRRDKINDEHKYATIIGIPTLIISMQNLGFENGRTLGLKEISL